MNRPSILLLLNRYLPGYKAGGPIRTIANMMAAIGDRYDFYIVTTDRDFGDTQAYPGIRHGEWMRIGKARVRYLAPEEMTRSTYRKILAERSFDLLYCQSFFNPKFTFLPLSVVAFGGYSKIPVLLAPRGEFGKGALAHKSFKKKLFLFVFRHILSKLLDYSFQCSSADEAELVRDILGGKVKCFCALDFSAQEHLPADRFDAVAPAGVALRIAFLGRIDVQKNVDYAIGVLRSLKIPAVMDFYGNVCDEPYYRHCLELAGTLPENVTVAFKGTLPHDEVLETLCGYDLFFFPSKNENFGHVIHEALRAGLPVLLSDTTPWHELDKRHAGWEIPLDFPERFAAAIEAYARMSPDERRAMRLAALQYGIDVSNDPRVRDANVAMFDAVLSAGTAKEAGR